MYAMAYFIEDAHDCELCVLRYAVQCSAVQQSGVKSETLMLKRALVFININDVPSIKK